MPHTLMDRRQPRRGAILAQAALLMTALIGILAIAVDGGLLMVERRHAQETADAAALGAAHSMYENSSSDSGLDPNGTAAARARNIASANGYTNDGTTSTVTVNVPPSSGNFSGKSGYVEVIAQYNQTRGFSSIFGTGAIPIRARAVAREATTAGVSILVLNAGNAHKALTLSGSATITVPGKVVVDGTQSDSATASGSAGLTSPEIDIVGGVDGGTPNSKSSVGFDLGSTQNVHTSYTPAMVDPLNNPGTYVLPAPDPATLTPRTVPAPSGGIIDLHAGVYTADPNPGGSTSIRLVDNGIYYFNGTKVTLNTSGTIYSAVSGTAVPAAGTLPSDASRTNVMIYIDPGGSTQALTVSNAIIQLRPPSSGTYQGISIFVKRTSTATVTTSNLNPYSYIEGTIYAAKAPMTLQGGSNIIVGTSIISDTLTLSGSSNFTVPPATILTPGVSGSVDYRLVE